MINPMRQYNDLPSEVNALSGEIVDCAFQVHQTLGPGFLESNYDEAMRIELERKNLSYEKQKSFQIPYKDTFLNTEFRFDLIVEKTVLVELKAVENIHPVHQAQIYAYLRATRLPLGLLVNFNTPLIKDGIGRYTLRDSASPRYQEGKTRQ